MYSELTSQEWAKWISNYPEAHLLQTDKWGSLKSGFGWKVRYIRNEQCGAMILFRHLPFGLKIAYLPKGPVGTGWMSLFNGLDHLCKQENVIFLRIEPDAWEGENEKELKVLVQFAPQSVEPIQPRRTIVIDLDGDENTWLMRMKQKTRYNIRLAIKNGLRVVESQDIGVFASLMQITGERDGFGVHRSNYYQLAYELFSAENQCTLLLASYKDRPIAGIMVFKRGSRAWFLFGGMSEEEKNRMPAYLVQWEAMRWAAAHGCTEYDLWGAPDFDKEILEANFQSRSDGLWGVYRFKRGFGGVVKRTTGAWDRIYQHSFYRMYQWYSKRRRSIIG